MDREILFRGKRVDNGEWVEGYLYRLSEKLNPFIMVINKSGEAYPVIPETVGQYTGLKDKNGKKIFEYMAVKHTQKYDISGIKVSLMVVKWSSSYGVWILKDLSNRRADMFLGNEAHRVEVIGNIHDGGIDDGKNAEKD